MAGSARISSVDWWRGFALVTIFINHIPGNPLEAATHKNFGFSDASEAFVFLAGIAAAFAYLPKFLSGNALRSTAKVVLRAFHLYVVHIAILCVAGAIIIFTALQTDDMRITEAMQFDLFMAAPGPALVGIVTLGHQPSFLNILPLYVVLLLIAPILMLGVRVSPGITLGCSAALYVATQVFDLRLPSYPVDGAWFFNPLAWQFLFAIGLVIGARLWQGRPIRPPAWLAWLSGAYLVLALVWTQAGVFLESAGGLPHFLWDFDKTNLHLPRLLHLLALVTVLSRLPMERWIVRSRGMQPLVLMGRHSLAVFGLGTVLSLLAQALRIAFGGAIGLDMLLVATGLLLQAVLAWFLEWNRLAQVEAPARAEAAAPKTGLTGVPG
jgi:hypothetical protein